MNQKKFVLAIIQARMGSSRLPGKVMEDIAGEPMISRVRTRVKHARLVDDVLVATSVAPADDPIEDFCRETGSLFFRGSERDVLDRYYGAARHYCDTFPDRIGPSEQLVLLRVTADCPLIDPEVIDRIIEVFLAGSFDYVSNTIHCTFPDGLDCEVFSFQALEKSWSESSLSLEREHVTPHMRTSTHFITRNVECDLNPDEPPLKQLVDAVRSKEAQPGLLKLRRQPKKNILSMLRWTVDDSSDLQLVRAIYGAFGSSDIFLMADILQLLRDKQHLLKINSDVTRNEGWLRTLLEGAQVPIIERKLANSMELKEEAIALIPSGTQTFSKSTTQFVQGVSPTFLSRGLGARVWDVDGNEYIDYPMALGPVILGHSYPAVNQAAISQIHDGTIFSLAHPLEVEVARLLVDMIPCAEMVRFGKNGSDATSGAVRVARAYTGRDMIACCGYHGWQDWFIGTTTRSRGVPEPVKKLTRTFSYNDIDSLRAVFREHPGQIAAVIMEPVGLVEPEDGFLGAVRDLAHDEGALLIFDEVVTGFRLSLGGAQEYFGVTPDLAAFGKAMANGFPISAVVGRRDIMEMFDEIFFSFTFGGDTVALAACLATLNEIRTKGVIAMLWEVGEKIMDGFNYLSSAYGIDHLVACYGLPPRTVAAFKNAEGDESLELKSLFQQECLKRGILFSGAHNVCFGHQELEVTETLNVYRTVFEIVSQAIKKNTVADHLEGPAISPVFRRA